MNPLNWVELKRKYIKASDVFGWLLKGDMSNLWFLFCWKTNHRLFKAYKFAKGESILDRNASCKKGKSL